MSADELNLITFNAISKFVSQLGELYGSKKTQRSLSLYRRLLKKTTIFNEKPIQKHINAFRMFCIKNRETIQRKDSNNLIKDTIKYSETAYINMRTVFDLVDAEDDKNESKQIKESIWNHILTISALVDPAGKAKEILKESSKNSSVNDGQEVNFIASIIDKVEKNVDPNSNPMEAVGSIMQSGIFTDLISDMNQGLQTGNLDIGKLMGAVTGMVSTMGNQSNPDQSDQQPDEAMNMITSMMGNIMSGMPPPGPPGPPGPVDNSFSIPASTQSGKSIINDIDDDE